MKRRLIAIVIVLPLTFLLSRNPPAWAGGPLRILLFPGMVVSVFITGGHGGTETQEHVALVASTLVNLAFYWFLVAVAGDLRRRFAKSPPNTR